MANKAFMSDQNDRYVSGPSYAQARETGDFAAGLNASDALHEARAILAETEPDKDGWTAHVRLSLRGNIVVGGPWDTSWQRYRQNIAVPVGTAELAESIAAALPELDRLAGGQS